MSENNKILVDVTKEIHKIECDECREAVKHLISLEKFGSKFICNTCNKIVEPKIKYEFSQDIIDKLGFTPIFVPRYICHPFYD
jgi:hypothetical protein